MFCRNCGTELKEGDVFCQNCGYATHYQQTAEQQLTSQPNLQPTTQPVLQKKKVHGFAITGFVLSMLSFNFSPDLDIVVAKEFLIFYAILSFVLAVTGLVFSVLGMHKAKKQQIRGKGLGIAGMVIGIICIVGSIGPLMILLLPTAPVV